MGGLARRVSYIKAFRHRSHYEVPTIFVDAGNLFTDDRYTAGQLPVEVMTKNRWVVKSYGDFRHTAANISHFDLPYVSELLKKDGFEQRLEDYPFINQLISANVKALDDAHNNPTPYLVREITVKRGLPGQKLRIGIVGFTDAKPAGINQYQSVHAGFQIEDPFEAARRVMPDLEQKADFIIALAYMSQEKAQRLATENPGIDTVVGARQLNQMTDLQHFNRASIAYAYNETKFLGELRVYIGDDGSVREQKNRYVGLDAVIPDDAAAQEAVTRAHTEFTNEQNKASQRVSSTAQPTSLLGGAGSAYAGVETCAMCHQNEYQIWQKTGHAHAMATLEAKRQQFDNECVGCHVVGFQNGGFQSLVTTPQFANVQCESCHGPGRQHVSSPGKGYGFMPVPVACTQCHTQPNSPDFDFETYWPRVKH